MNLLLLSELSRLGRSTLQVLKSLELLHEDKVSVYIQNGGKLGRKVGYRISEQELRERYPKEIALLKKGYSV